MLSQEEALLQAGAPPLNRVVFRLVPWKEHPTGYCNRSRAGSILGRSTVNPYHLRFNQAAAELASSKDTYNQVPVFLRLS